MRNGLPAEVPDDGHNRGGGICNRRLTRDQRRTVDSTALGSRIGTWERPFVITWRYSQQTVDVVRAIISDGCTWMTRPGTHGEGTPRRITNQ
jgi:hypothetical protein